MPIAVPVPVLASISAPDAVVALVLAACGLGILRRRRLLPGLLLLAAAVLWAFDGVGPGLALAHRGPLTHALLGYPRARLTTVVERVLVALVYLVVLVNPFVSSDLVTATSGLAVIALAGYRLWSSRGVDRRARATALLCLVLIWGVAEAGAALRFAGVHADAQVLVLYRVTVAAIGVIVVVDLRFGRARRAAVAGLAVDLGRTAPRSLRDLLAETLADPTLVLAYVDPVTGQQADETGRPARLDAIPLGRVATELRDDEGRRVAVLVHDAGVLDDPLLVASVTTLAELAVSNRRLRAEVADRIAEVEASRRRLLSVADAERARLEAQTRDVQERLARAAALIAPGPGTAILTEQLAAGQAAVQDFARGLHPRTLQDHGLPAAVADLAARAPLPVAVTVPDQRFALEVEAAAYFVCAEALTNIAKYARATTAVITVAIRPGGLVVEVRDDGVGGADPNHGSGLTGLADRLDVQDGHLQVDSPPGQGTTIVATLPLPGR